VSPFQESEHSAASIPLEGKAVHLQPRNKLLCCVVLSNFRQLTFNFFEISFIFSPSVTSLFSLLPFIPCMSHKRARDGEQLAEMAPAGSMADPRMMLIPSQPQFATPEGAAAASVSAHVAMPQPAARKKAKKQPTAPPLDAQTHAASFSALVAASAPAPPISPDGKKVGTAEHRNAFVRRMETFWEDQLEETKSAAGLAIKPSLPLARIKKLMKADEDVRATVMVSSEAPLLLCKAIELFTLDLTMRAWAHTDSTGRKTLQRSDVADAIATTEQLDFLLDTVPRDESAQQQPVPVRKYQSTRRGMTPQLFETFTHTFRAAVSFVPV
jgi:nuclear transcription factor Y gamma